MARLTPAGATQSEGRLEPDRRARGHGLRVLIVEDDPSTRWVLGSLMRKLGYECRTAANGQEALEAARSFAPQVILMDLMMPVLDGMEATRRLKADARTRGVPVLALTGNVTPDGFSAARQAGCDDVLPKPIALPDLLGRLDRLARS